MSDTACELGISYQLLRTWMLAVNGVNEPAPTAANSMLAADDELFQLKVENARLRRENDVLRKAAAHFAREILRGKRTFLHGFAKSRSYFRIRLEDSFHSKIQQFSPIGHA